MPEQMYHAFWIDPVGREIKHKSTYDEVEILALRKQVDAGYSHVSNLKVVYGAEVEFEPVKIVDSYRIKD